MFCIFKVQSSNPTKVNTPSSKNAQKKITFFPQSLTSSPTTLSSHAQIQKPIMPKLLVLLKKLRKHEELKLLRHCSYGEYQFSASSTPLIQRSYHRNQFKSRGPHRGLCSFLYIYWCLGNFKVEGTEECHVEALPVSLSVSPFEIEDALVAGEDYLFEDCGGSGDEEGESVDQKAERFIQSFYKQIRMQRHESL